LPKGLRERLIGLLDYVKQVVRLDEHVAFRLSEYRLPDGTAFAVGEPDTRNLPGIHHDVREEEGPVWLEVMRLARKEPPPPSPEIAEWIVLSADPARLPQARSQRLVTVTAVTVKGAEPGEVVAAGRMVLQVARQGGQDAVFNVPSQLIRQSPKNPEVTVALSDDPAVVATGHVREVAPQADAATGTYVVKVGLDNPPDIMRLGATIMGQVKIQSEPVIQLPGTALTQSEGKPAVWVVDPEKKTVSLLPVTVGHYDTSSIIVVGGLRDGDLVVTAGVQALRPGQQVRLLETDAAVQLRPSKNS
jgi:multidrug efflux pump subunit AcrA (membrane-fusion protein)